MLLGRKTTNNQPKNPTLVVVYAARVGVGGNRLLEFTPETWWYLLPDVWSPLPGCTPDMVCVPHDCASCVRACAVCISAHVDQVKVNLHLRQLLNCVQHAITITHCEHALLTLDLTAPLCVRIGGGGVTYYWAMAICAICLGI